MATLRRFACSFDRLFRPGHSAGTDGKDDAPILCDRQANSFDIDGPGEPSLRKFHRLPSSSDARALNDLGSQLLEEGDVLGAEPLFRQALDIAQNTLGEEHADTAVCLGNLADVLVQKGDLVEGENFHRTSLAIKEKVLGENHPGTAYSYNNLAGLLQIKGELKAAQELYMKALSVKREILGPQSKSTATTLNNLSALLYARGDLSGAEVHLREALAIKEALLGQKHLDTAICHNNLANLLMEMGKPEEAEPHMSLALDVRTVSLGPRHPDTKSSFAALKSINKAVESRSKMSMDSNCSSQHLGVSVRWLFRFYERIRKEMPAGFQFTSADVVERCIKPETIGSGDLCYLEETHVQTSTPQFVISHSWDCPFEALVECLRRRFEYSEGTVIWLDILALNLHSESPENCARIVAEQGAAAEGTLLVVDPAGACFSQAICLYQIYIAASVDEGSSSSPVPLQPGKQTRLELLPYLLDTGNRQLLASAMDRLSMSSAGCPISGLKDAIVRGVDQACGRPTFDNVVSVAAAEGVADIVSYIVASTEDTDEARACLASDVAKSLSTAGHHMAAQPLLQICLEIQEGRLGADHQDCIETRKHLAAELQALGKASEAQVLLQCVPAVSVRS